VQIRIEASDLPGRSCGPSPERPSGHGSIHIGVQRRNQPGELLDLVPGDAPSATWTLERKAARSSTDVDLTDPYIQGRPGGRFIYLSWGTLDEAHDFRMFRRAKLQLDAVPPAISRERRCVRPACGPARLDRYQGQPALRSRTTAGDRLVSRTRVS
jgi:Family of unknown function (DUF5990)